jgi:hypothetical protein
MNDIIKGLLIATGVVLFVSAMVLAGYWDAEAAEMSERRYCELVLANVHTNYKSINCGE